VQISLLKLIWKGKIMKFIVLTFGNLT